MCCWVDKRKAVSDLDCRSWTRVSAGLDVHCVDVLEKSEDCCWSAVEKVIEISLGFSSRYGVGECRYARRDSEIWDEYGENRPSCSRLKP